MTALVRDREFALFVEDERALLQRCAYLLVGQRAAADDLVSATLADLYGHWGRTRLASTPRLEAFRLLFTSDPTAVRLPWARRARFELLDASPVREPVAPVVTDLGHLRPEQRLVLVLERVARLPSVEIAAVLGAGVDDTLALARSARAALVAERPERADDAVLADELAQAVPDELRRGRTDDDLAHGRALSRRRWARRAVAAVAAAVLLVLVITRLPEVAPQPVAAPAPAVTVTASPPSRAACDRAEPACQASLVRAWRASMAEIVIGHLDPEGTYFNSSSFYARDQTEGLFETKEGSLGLQLSRIDGATEIYLQIATDRARAPRCGRLTGNSCVSTRFMDGNRFILTRTSTVAEGLEAQYRPEGRDVITVVARNTGRGRTLDLQRSDLVELLQDGELRLPTL